MIYGKKNIIAWFESTGMQYWTIYAQGKSDSGNAVSKSDESEHATHQTALNDLQQRIGWFNGKYTIVASAVAKNASKGTYREDFQLSMTEDSASPVGVIQQPVISGFSNDDIEKRINERVNFALQEKENRDMKDKIKELEKENKSLQDNSPLATIAGIAKEHAPQLIALLNPAPAPVARVAGLTASEVVDEDQGRLENIVSILSQIDPDWLIKLEKLALKVQGNPSYWTMVNSFL